MRIIRIAEKYKCKCDDVFYAKEIRKIKVSLGKNRIGRRHTELYKDESCKELVYEIERGCPRVMRDGVYRMYELIGNFQKFIYVICVDNGVRKNEVEGQKYKYKYEE
jgi:hypothetical protein